MIKFDNIKEEDQKKEYRNMVSSYLNWVTNKYYVGKLLELVFSPVIDIEIKAKLIYKYPDKKVEDISSLVDVKISSINQPFYENEKECKTVGINLNVALSHDDILDPSSSFESNAIEYDIYDKNNGKMIAKMIREYNTEYLDSMKEISISHNVSFDEEIGGHTTFEKVNEQTVKGFNKEFGYEVGK